MEPMRLYLVRHGKALPDEVASSRPLSPAGREEVTRLAEFLCPLRLRPSAVWHSPKRRAAETAEILIPALDAHCAPTERSGIAPNDHPGRIVDELTASEGDHVIVGHLPFLERIASLLVMGQMDPPIVMLPAGGAVCLERDAFGAWTICWMVEPSMLPPARSS